MITRLCDHGFRPTLIIKRWRILGDLSPRLSAWSRGCPQTVLVLGVFWSVVLGIPIRLGLNNQLWRVNRIVLHQLLHVLWAHPIDITLLALVRNGLHKVLRGVVLDVDEILMLWWSWCRLRIWTQGIDRVQITVEVVREILLEWPILLLDGLILWWWYLQINLRLCLLVTFIRFYNGLFVQNVGIFIFFMLNCGSCV